MAHNKTSKGLIIFLIILVAVLALTITAILFKDQISSVVTPVYNNIVGNTFVYADMHWQKEYLGNLTLYSTELAIDNNGQIRYYVLRLYNDPRKLKTNENITKKILPKVYISFTNNSFNCNGITLTAMELGMFMNALGKTASGAFTDYNRAVQELNISGNYTNEMIMQRVKNCSDSKSASVIIVDTGSSTQEIYNDFSDANLGNKENCFIIKAQGCNHLEASETFILDLLNLMKVNQTAITNSSNITMPKKQDNSQINLSEALNTSENDLVVGN